MKQVVWMIGLIWSLLPIPVIAAEPERSMRSASSPSASSPSASQPALQLVPWQPQTTPLLGQDDRLWQAPSDRVALLAAIDHSLDYLQTPNAAAAYQKLNLPGISRDRVERSLRRFRQLVIQAQSAEQLQAAIMQEFDLYQSIGSDGAGSVHFTGYFEPVHLASRVPTPEFQYPLYRLPSDFQQWPTPHPTRAELEGVDGLQGSTGRLNGLEIAWLRDRLDAYLVQVQGSARLRLLDGSTLSIGYAGRTDYPYVSIGRELVNAGKIAAEELTLNAVQSYFQAHPAELDRYLPRNNRFIFFKETHGAPAIGTLRVPVTAGRSIATDRSLMPPGALGLIYAQLPDANGRSNLVNRYVLDQDTGGAIRGAGRVDLFVGTGDRAATQAGLINHDGQLYYLLLKP
ncbi:MAG: murein transglycosylase A [Elainella sp. Prado103]|nr:murein transglycosylase A [Elainella sp. Prado103]